MIKTILRLGILTSVLFMSSCASTKHKNISYLHQDTIVKGTPAEQIPMLNVFEPRKKSSTDMPVVIFVHGGNWNSGKKEIYSFIGRNFAKKNVVTVIPGYTLSPEATFHDMAKQVAKALQWTKNNIAIYGGNPEQIYVMGHSAGGHLVALVATNAEYFENPAEDIAGIILDDAAGLDMYSYLQNNPPKASNNYDTTWTLEPENWKDASPIYFLDKNTPPFKIYVGLKTYASIEKYNKVFLEELQKYQPNVQPTYLDKKHVPMVTQFLWPWSDRYDEIVQFINENK